MKCSWREGNKIQLLENGEQYYPAVFKAIGEAQNASFLKRLSGLRMTSANSCMRRYWQQRNAG
ncbi:putative phospholipase [Escherichia coli]|uniref:Putative phospholipase n=1 Tax=Escherichia coli TaxID=562 RepID=A0A376W114_ECOLX|nr:putative phospholipase [Escherichia coli]